MSRRCNLNYTILDKNNITIKQGHLNYSLSTWIKFLIQTRTANQSTHSFWKMFDTFLNTKNAGLAYFSLLNRTGPLSIESMVCLHAFGAAILESITKSTVKFKSKNPYVITAGTDSMVFHKKKPNMADVTKNSYKYHAYYVLNNKNYSVFHNGYNNFQIEIIDPIAPPVECENDFYEKITEELRVSYDGKYEFDICKSNERYEVMISLDCPDSKLYDVEKLGGFYICTRAILKSSKLNRFIDDNLVVNLFSGSCIKLDKEKYDALKNGSLTLFTDEELAKLHGMMFVNNFVSENKYFKQMQKDAIENNTDKLGLTILTTTGCNARCPYCYEAGIKCRSVNDTVSKNIIDFIKRSGKKKVNISWFGGEPLTNGVAINSIINSLSENNIEYTSTMISNGYLVDKYIDEFEKWNLKSIQITIDGVGDKYNNTKLFVYKNDIDPFAHVIENIGKILERNIRVAIRLNFDRNNYKDILEVIEYLHGKFGNNKNLNVYVAHIYGNEEQYHLPDGTNIYYLLYQSLMKFGYIKSLKDLHVSNRVLPCFIYERNHFVVDPDGRLFRCEHQVINDDVGLVGDLSNGITNKINDDFWQSFDYPYAKCKLCKFKYLCLGGCKSDSIVEGHNACLPIIDCFDDIVKLYYRKNEIGK